MRYVHFALFLLVPATAANAQEEDEVLARLLAAESVGCELDAGTTASWDGGTQSIETARYGEGGTFVFQSIDTDAGRARLIGNADSVDVTVLAIDVGLSFMELSQAGNLTVTTVFAVVSPQEPNRLLAVESHHHGWPRSWRVSTSPESEQALPFPSQYHGTCVILE